MKFKNTAERALSFRFHGETHAVAAGGEWECPARLAYAVQASGLPLKPVGDIDEAIEAEKPKRSGAEFREGVAVFASTAPKPLDFQFHGRTHHVDPGQLWECPERLVYAVEARGLPLKRIEPRNAAPAPAEEPEAKAGAEARAKARAQTQAADEARAKADAEAEAKAKAEADAKAQAAADAEAKAKAEAEAKAKSPPAADTKPATPEAKAGAGKSVPPSK
jgi:hypothetical protein